MKLTLKNLKPRNPFVAPSLHRVAGTHALSNGARRQQAQRELRHELKREQMRGQKFGPTGDLPRLHPSP